MRAFIAQYFRASYLVPAALVASTFVIVAIAGIMQSHATKSHQTATPEAVTEVAPATEAALKTEEIEISETVPAAALRAYQEAASAVATAASSTTETGCNLDWTLLAGLGAVTSDHGRTTGRLSAEGGQPQGPFQFTTATWDVYGADADGDQVRDVDNIDDSALAAALFLCATGKDLSTESGTRAALEAFNRDDAFIALVLSATATYKDEVPEVSKQPETLEAAGDNDLEVVCRDEIGAAKLDVDELDEMVLLCTDTFADTDISEAKAEIKAMVTSLD